MKKLSKAQLLATSAIAGLSILSLAPAAQAQQAFGVHNDQPQKLVVIVGEGETVEGDDIGVYAEVGAVDVENDGTIRGNDTGGIVVAQPNSTIDNRGLIDGNRFGILGDGNLDGFTVTNNGAIAGAGGDGVYVNTTGQEVVAIDNQADAAIEGAESGVHVELGAATITNAGTIRGNGSNLGFDAPPDAGVTLSGGVSAVTNSGTISGTRFGVTTAGRFNPETELLESLAIDTTVVNTGTIIGDNDDGVRLIGGGSVTNSGTISGRTEAFADGVSMFAYTDQANEDYSALVTNQAGGQIDGSRFGVILSGGGDVANAGAITGVAGGIFIQGTALNTDASEDRSGLSASVVNTGTITGTGDFGGSGGEGYGVGFGSDMSTATLDNSGTIGSEFGAGVSQGSLADLTINNAEGGVITGATSGIYGGSGGTMTIINAGTIRGNGAYDGFDAPPDAGITIATTGSSVTNSGTISGAGGGITTAYVFDEELGELVFVAAGTTVENSGTIAGELNDGVRLIGGGAVTNSGTITGSGQPFADGISMFAYGGQPQEEYNALVSNAAEGTIAGERFGVILSSGGDVVNAGAIEGVAGGVYLQGTGLDSEERTGLSASVVNSGTITGTGDLGGSGGDGYGVGFGSDLETATLENSGTIESEFGAGVNVGTLADVTVTNSASGVITGATSGIYSFGGGTLTVNNAGTIRGEGSYDGFDDVPDAGVTIGTAGSGVVNSGTISGAGGGITTAYVLDDVGALVFLAAGTTVENSGTIAGEANDGVRLIGGGTVTNSGTISGNGSPGADGVSMFRFEGQAAGDYSASVANSSEGSITGDRLGVILSGGGSVDNAGLIDGTLGGVVIQSQFDGEDAGLAGALTNSGTITSESGAGAQFNAGLASVVVENSGTITGATLGLGHGTAGTLALTNSGTIAGGVTGVESNADGAVTLVNTGTIAGESGAAFTSATQTSLDNAGVLAGGNGIAVALGAFDDTVTLRTGSDITGTVDAGDGVDSLTLAGDVLELTEAQELGASLGFETLAVASGYWTTTGAVGEFGSVTIAEGGALQVNEVDLGDAGFTSPILTSAVTTNGLLVLNFSEDDLVSEFDALTIGGAGGLQLIGEAVFTVDTATLTYTGGTTVSNGGLVLTGTLAGDVATEGDGFFQLGAGGTEGSFSGDIVNDGRFVFNRSDDYEFLGSFSGSGVLDKLGDGVLTFMGDYAFQGVTNIMGGAVRIGGTIDPETDFNLEDGGALDITGKDQTVGGLSGQETATVELGEQTLTVNQQENTQFAGAISGMGGIVKSGEGILNLTGDSTYTGPTEVNGGTLAVNGSIVSDVTVNAGGTLGGNGTTGDATVGDGGTLAPGNSIGRLTVDGDLSFAAGSIYEVEVNAAGEGDRVDATGAVTIADTASVAVLAEAGDYAPRTDYVIVTGAEGVTGTFGSVTTDLAFLDPLLRYDANTVTLSLYRNDVDFVDVAANANQVGVAGAVQALGIDNPLFEAVLLQNAATARATFGDLSGEILASTITGLTDDSRHLRNALLGMAAPEEAGMFVWGSAFGGWGDFDGSTRNFGMGADHKGLVAGVGLGGDGFGVALSGGLGGSDFDLDGRRDSAEVNSKYLAANATLGASGGFHGAAGISYAWHDVETVRAVEAAPLTQTLASDRDANTLQVFGELGYDVTTGSMAITPFARLAHVRTESDAFAETGGNAALVVGEAEQETTFLSLGARAQFTADGEGFRPYLSAAWNHAFGDRTAVVGSRFAAGGPGFAVAGLAIPENSAEVEAGFDYTSGAFSVGAAYSGTLAGDRTSHGARVTAKVAF